MVAGLGVAGAAAVAGAQSRRVLLVAFALTAVAAVVIGGRALPYWAWAAAWIGASALGLVSLRRLSAAALPAATVAAAVLAFVPAVGYLEALVAPVVGWRLRRRAGGRYAGLRVLAKD